MSEAETTNTQHSGGRFSGIGRLLFEPSASVLGAAERRKARLLSIFQFTHIVIFGATGIEMRLAESGALQTRGALMLSGAALATVASYALSRTRHVNYAAWWYILLNIWLGPLMILLCPPEKGTGFIAVAFQLITVMLASVFVSSRGTLLCAVVSLTSTVYALFASREPPPPEELRPAIIFFLSAVTLFVVFGLHRDGIEADRSAELRARNAELEGLRRTLEDRIVARTAELGSRNSQMRLVLDNVTQALFTMDRSGVISFEHSAVLTKWFGPLKPDERFNDYFGRCLSSFGAQLECGWQQVVEDVLPVEVSLAQLPNLLAFDGRRFRFSFEPISGANAERYLVVVTDVTAEFEREVLEREKRESLALFEHMLADRAGFVSFMEEGSQIVEKISSVAISGPEFSRAVHTLKGNAMLFGIETVSRLCHQLESALAEGQHMDKAELAPLQQRWVQVIADVDRLLGERRHVIEISPKQHAALERAVDDGRPRAELLQLVQELKLEPVERRLQQFAEQARQLAARLSKEASVEVCHDGLRFDRQRWAPLWAAFVHAVRNAVDHGIEAPSERSRLGKPAQGAIFLRARRDGESIRIELEDDGRGIDWDAVRDRCSRRGVRTSTHEDLVAALFGGGVSTASEVTELSGRGVGMGALHSAVVELGGQLHVQSQFGSGTRLQMLFPATAAAH
jgi:HPt (histidine-containing phosphotransfer) domain-containing protein